MIACTCMPDNPGTPEALRAAAACPCTDPLDAPLLLRAAARLDRASRPFTAAERDAMCDHPSGCERPGTVLVERPGEATDLWRCAEHAEVP